MAPRDRIAVAPARIAAPGPPAARRPAAFTVDVEDWYQSCIDYDAPITERVVRNTERLLGVLDEHGVHATFFVQGRVAETFPSLVRSLVAQGHEVQSHGYSHRPLHRLGPAALRDELARAKATVEDAAGAPVTAFRAQDFSVLAANLHVLDLLADLGFRVDSSIFPMRSRHYGIPGWRVGPHWLALPGGGRLLEVPVAVWARGRLRVPLAGGGYFRVLPRRVLAAGVAAIARERPAVVYCHPYELATGELDAYRDRIPRATRLWQSFGRAGTARRFGALFAAHPFGRLDAALAAWGLAP
ncbi:MAG TPA: polysaccharide deacetylase family protein [Solirubrobacteraceae bacterium]|jgi:polysaccharide deacetylase family protein (PEP-CTERM system associated)